MSKRILILLFTLISLQGWAQDVQHLYNLRWSELPPLPPAVDQQVQPGMAGAFAGVHHNALIIAGGANFPDEVPWKGGEKVWWDDIYVLEQEGDNYHWVNKDDTLPEPLAYGISISTEKGIFCIGGNDEMGSKKDVFLLNWNPDTKNITITDWPPLPIPLSNMAGAKVGNIIYIAGGENQEPTQSFFALDISAANPSWQALPPWPGPARTHAVGAAQNHGEADCFYLFAGRRKKDNGVSALLHDAYVYNPLTSQWKELHPVADAEGNPLPLSAGTGYAAGANHILLFGGAKGKLLNKLEHLAIDISRTEGSQKEKLIAESNEILENHPGFSKDILAYHTLTDTWIKLGELPGAPQVTTSVVKWGNDFILPSGEISPGIRTPKIWKATPQSFGSFGWLNYTVLLVYLLLLVVLGFWVSKNQKTTVDFFRASGRIPWWAAGLSIFGTQLSAITFMAIPAKSFATDWTLFFLLMTIILVAPVVIFYFLPFYRRLNITTAYEYLEKRFNLATRLIGGVMYITLQLSRLGIVLLLPSLALSVVTGLDVSLCILIMGVLSIVYTVLGGIEAVIWTDVLQVIVLMGGALLCLVLIPLQIDRSWGEIWDTVTTYDKMRILDFRFDIATPTFWVVVFGGFASNLVQYGSDQTVVQRYLTTKDEKSAARGILTGTFMTLPSALIFFSIGTALFLFFKTHPVAMNPTLENGDTIFPWYIITQLPQGVSGLLIAAIFAAAMSSLDSSMNSVATVLTTDFYKRLSAEKKERTYLNFARVVTVFVGAIGTGLALVMAQWGIASLWDQFNMVVGLFAGGLGGLFMLGIFTRRTNGAGAVMGLLASGLIQFLVKSYTPVHLQLYAFTGVASAMIFGYLFSILFSGSRKNTRGLTIYSFPPKTPGQEKEAVKKHIFDKV